MNNMEHQEASSVGGASKILGSINCVIKVLSDLGYEVRNTMQDEYIGRLDSLIENQLTSIDSVESVIRNLSDSKGVPSAMARLNLSNEADSSRVALNNLKATLERLEQARSQLVGTIEKMYVEAWPEIERIVLEHRQMEMEVNGDSKGNPELVP